MSDGKVVMLKMILRSKHPFEVEIGQYFSSKDLVSEPSNHCIPILEVLAVPDYKDLDIIVMPLLRLYKLPSFKTIGESVEFFRQIFEVRVVQGYSRYNTNCASSRAFNSCISIMLPIGTQS